MSFVATAEIAFVKILTATHLQSLKPLQENWAKLWET